MITFSATHCPQERLGSSHPTGLCVDCIAQFVLTSLLDATPLCIYQTTSLVKLCYGVGWTLGSQASSLVGLLRHG
jgi:hypothetical protein